MIKFIDMPYTEFGANMTATDQNGAEYRVLYRLDGKGGAVFHSLYDETYEYEDDYLALPLRSVVKKESDPFDAGTCFANVEGSTKDKPKDSSKTWIEIMRGASMQNCQLDSCCAETDKIYKGDSDDERAYTDVKGNKEFKCRSTIVGGHVIMNAKNSAELDEGSDVMMLPICNGHNIFYYTSVGGKGYYMKTSRRTSALVMKNYIKEKDVVKND